MQKLQQSEATAALRRILFQAVDETDGISPETAQTGTGFFSKNGAVPVASAGSIVEISAANMPGRYYIEPTAAEIDTLGIIEFRYKAAATAEVVIRAQVVPYDPYDAVALGLSRLDADVSSRSSHTAAAAGTDAAAKILTTPANKIDTEADGMVHADLKEWLGAAPDALSSGKIAADLKLWLATAPLALVAQRVDASVGAMAASVLTAAAIAANALTSGKFATDAVNANAFAQAAADKVFGPGAAVLAELPQGIPPATPRPDQFAMLIYMALRNRVKVTSSELGIFNDALVKIAKAALTDDDVTFQREEMVSGA